MLKTPEELRLELGQAIRVRRLGRGWSQEEAAKRAGMGISTWKRMETHGPGLVDNMINAAFALRCEDGFSQLFPAPAAANLDELLQRQAAAMQKNPSAGAATSVVAMRLAPGTPLSIAVAFEPGSEPLAAGRLAMDGGLAQLEWSGEVIARSLPVSPVYYPPEPGLAAARTRSFDGLHGFLADSLPDGWGYLLMRKRLAKLGVDIGTLSPLERLALVGNHGRGALTFEPATAPADDVQSLDLDALAKESMALLMGEESRLADTLASLAGGSGGARPKVHVGFDGQGHISVGQAEVAKGHTAWLVKFPAPSDPADIGPIEEAYACMAETAGLIVSAHRLLPAKSGPGYFATRRFDRPDSGGRLHMVSLAGAIEAPSDAPSSYDLFLRATRAITRRADDVALAFRRMVFNVLACNRDDHTRQHAYLMDVDGEWRLAPAFDLTYAPGPGGEHYLDIEGEGRRPTRAQVTSLGKRHGLDARSIRAVVEDITAALADWPIQAKHSGVSKDSMKMVSDALARVMADFETA